MGLETEYGFTPYDCDGRALDRAVFTQHLVSLAARRYPSLYGSNIYDVFLSNGGRLYADAGMGLLNTEFSTPECESPLVLVAHVRAGDRLLASAARELESEQADLEKAFITKTNFDYSGRVGHLGHTSGSHENFLHTAPQTVLESQLVPHLITRIVYTGGGGFSDRSSKLDFLLSPRVPFLENVSSVGSHEKRGIFNTRQEPLSQSRFGRLHLLCGEGVRCDVTEYLRFGVTALIVLLIDSGATPAEDVEIDPLVAMNAVTRDLDCAEKVARIGGVPASAIDVQRHYLCEVQNRLGGAHLPEWAESVCQRWATVLDALERDPMTMAGTLDWPTKLGLYRAFAADKGLDWERLTQVSAGAPREVRAAFFELDIRFGDISDDSPFSAISDDPSYDRLVTDQEIDIAVRTPPQGTRARLRGEWVSQLAHDQRRNWCDWNRIRNRLEQKSLRFDDPFGRADVAWVTDR